MTVNTIVLVVLSAGILLSSCAAKKKLQTATNDIQVLTEKNAELTKQREELSEKAGALQSSLNSVSEEYAQYQKTCEANEAKLKEMQSVDTREDQTMERVEEKLDSALQDFKDKGVEVYAKDGWMYVSMADNLLYKTGSWMVSRKGRKSLANLATVLNDYPNLKVIVLGNTDDKSYKNGIDNWTLSTERANGVLRVLEDDYKIDPKRLTAAGKGKYNPAGDNQSAAGRAKNRRTEIILNPDLDRLLINVLNEQR